MTITVTCSTYVVGQGWTNPKQTLFVSIPSTPVMVPTCLTQQIKWKWLLENFETIIYLHLMSACKFGDTVDMNMLHIKCTIQHTLYKACKHRLISTHSSVCNDLLTFKATAIILTASSDIPVKLWVDHWNYLQHQGDHNCNMQHICCGARLNKPKANIICEYTIYRVTTTARM